MGLKERDRETLSIVFEQVDAILSRAIHTAEQSGLPNTRYHMQRSRRCVNKAWASFRRETGDPTPLPKLNGDTSDHYDWQDVADQLKRSLDTFMAYDGMGQGGAENGNQGDWKGAHAALVNYEALRGEL